MMRVFLSAALLTFGLSARAAQEASCADAYERSSERYIQKLNDTRAWTENARPFFKAGITVAYAGCSIGLIAYGGPAICLAGAYPLWKLTDAEAPTVVHGRLLDLHLVNLIYEQSKQESTEGSQVVHALAQTMGWSESEVVAEVARRMEAGDLCQSGKASVTIGDLASRLSAR